MPAKRDYKKEYRDYHGKPSQIKRRSSRNKARRKLGLKKGDGKEVDHRDGNANNNSRKNLRVTKNKKAHRKQGGSKSKGK
jgi:hypothetical protein